MTHHFKIRPADKVRYIVFVSGEEVIDAKNVVATLNQAFAKVRPQESCAARHDNASLSILGHNFSAGRSTSLMGI
jgi:hypothetical protein